MSKRLHQSQVSGFFKRSRAEVEDHVATLDDDGVEPVVTRLRIKTDSTPDFCTSSSTPSFYTTYTQFATVNDLSKKVRNHGSLLLSSQKTRPVDILVFTGILTSPG